MGEYARAAHQMIKGMRSAEFVDRYIDRFNEDEIVRDLGKAAIVEAIAFAESKSLLFGDKGEAIQGKSAVDGTWYWALARMLFEGVNHSQLPAVFNNVSIICFNYDRCIEIYLTQELMRAFNIERQLAAALVHDCLKIWHPYGTIAPLDARKNGSVGFGQCEDFRGRCFDLGGRIKTFTEKHEDVVMIEDIRECLHRASTVVFLGFGHYKQNLELIQPGTATKISWVLGTGYGLSASARNVVIEGLYKWHGGAGSVELVSQPTMKCVDLLRDYRMQLSV